MSSAPFDLVDFLFDFEGLEVVEFGLVGLEFGVEFVFASLFGFIAFKEDDSPALVAGCEVVARLVELYGGDDVGCEASRSAGIACKHQDSTHPL